MVPVATLLRKVKLAAVKLGLSATLAWVEQELAGYDGPDIPDYRKVQGQTQAMNMHMRWTPVHFGDASFSDLVALCWLRKPIGNYEALIAQTGDGTLTQAIAADLVESLNESFGWQIVQAKNTVPLGHLTSIVERVRNMVLDWAIELERAGVTGERLGFSMQVPEKVASAHIHIGEFHGSFSTGDAIGANARLNQASSDTSTNVSGDGSIYAGSRQRFTAR